MEFEGKGISDGALRDIIDTGYVEILITMLAWQTSRLIGERYVFFFFFLESLDLFRTKITDVATLREIESSLSRTNVATTRFDVWYIVRSTVWQICSIRHANTRVCRQAYLCRMRNNNKPQKYKFTRVWEWEWAGYKSPTRRRCARSLTLDKTAETDVSSVN